MAHTRRVGEQVRARGRAAVLRQVAICALLGSARARVGAGQPRQHVRQRAHAAADEARARLCALPLPLAVAGVERGERERVALVDALPCQGLALHRGHGLLQRLRLHTLPVQLVLRARLLLATCRHPNVGNEDRQRSERASSSPIRVPARMRRLGALLTLSCALPELGELRLRLQHDRQHSRRIA